MKAMKDESRGAALMERAQTRAMARDGELVRRSIGEEAFKEFRARLRALLEKAA